MRISLEPTAEFFLTDDGYPVRMWTGKTDRGTDILAFISAICAPANQDQSQLEEELRAIPGPGTPKAAERQ
jgi:hypothetical protein